MQQQLMTVISLNNLVASQEIVRKVFQRHHLPFAGRQNSSDTDALE
jgi:hypothetical protein